MIDSRLETNQNKYISILKRFAVQREFSVTIIFIVLFIALALSAKNFLTFVNLRAFLMAFSIDAVVAVGMVILLIGGGFDLSVGSILALSGGVMNLCLRYNYNPFLAVFLGFITGIICGMINGLLISRIGINALIVTLATMQIYRSLNLIILGGTNTNIVPEVLAKFADRKFLGLEFYIWFMVILVILFAIALNKTRFFRQIFYIGVNKDSARFVGINVKNMIFFNYVLMGTLSSIAGIEYVFRFKAASVSIGTNTSLDVITAVIIGGASLYGGKGSVRGALIGLGLMVLITTGLVFWGIDVNWQRFIVGAILILAVSIDAITRTKK